MTPLESPEAMARARWTTHPERDAARKAIRADREVIAARFSVAIESADPFPALRALLAEIGGSK